MKIAILYICTGRYDVFWDEFYESCEKYFLTEAERHYFVFTDAKAISGESQNERIHKIYQERMGWPNDTLLRFRLFSAIDERLTPFDYIFFFNANAKFLRTVKPDEVLPNNQERLVAVLHPGYYHTSPKNFTYESKQKQSTAYIAKGQGNYYFAGGVNGGEAVAYRELIKELEKNIDDDLSKSIVAVWHDESHLNKFLLNRHPKILMPSFVYPEGWSLPFEPVILIRDKAKLGGHSFLRHQVSKKSLRKQFAALMKKFIGR